MGTHGFTKVFLYVYGAMLLVHVFEMGVTSLLGVSAICAGLALAIFAHKRHGLTPSIFLVCHIAIEWYVHAKHGSHYGVRDVSFHLPHAVFEAMLLFMEAKHHWGKKWWSLLFVFAAGIMILFWWQYVPYVAPMKSFNLLVQGASSIHVHTPSVSQQFIVSGMLGCVLMHLFYQKKHAHSCPTR